MASLAHIIYPPPTRKGWDEWIWWHAQHHAAIEQGMFDKLGVPPVIYQLHPFFEGDMQNWLLAHQSAHNRFGSVLSVATQDLGELDFKNKSQYDAWLYQNYIEHLAAAQRLGTSIT